MEADFSSLRPSKDPLVIPSLRTEPGLLLIGTIAHGMCGYTTFVPAAEGSKSYLSVESASMGFTPLVAILGGIAFLIYDRRRKLTPTGPVPINASAA